MRVDLAHVLVPFVLHDAADLGERGQGKPGWYSLRTSATRSVIRISVSVMPSTSPLRSMALKRRMYCSIMPICSRTVFSFAASSSTTSGESVSGQPMSTASAYSSDAR